MKHTPLASFIKRYILFFYIFTCTLSVNSQWVELNSGTTKELWKIYFINENIGFLSANQVNFGVITGEIHKTTNGGISWQKVHSDSNFLSYDFHFFNSNTGIAVGGTLSYEGYIYKTTNGGNNWVKITPVPLAMALLSVMFVNQNTGFASGYHGVYKTTDSGNSWSLSLYFNVITFGWGKIHFIDANTGLLSWDRGRIYKTTDAGLTWQGSFVAAYPTFRDIKFIDNNTGFICGDSGKVFKTINQGENWVELNSGSSFNLFSLCMQNANTGFCFGSQTVIKTTNGGINWFSVYNAANKAFFSSFFLNDNTGFVSGYNGIILKTTNGGVIGISPVSNEIPRDFSLYQNYPNPFNPSTKIRFAIAKESSTKLVVYNTIGMQIAVLADQNLHAGIYEIDFKSENLPSGIYYYRLSSGELYITKKMILVK